MPVAGGMTLRALVRLAGMGLAALVLWMPPHVHAHNGAVALAAPIQGITVDGDLAEWPDSVPWHPITVLGVGEAPASTDDYAGRFAVDYNPNANVLYLAIEVVDEFTVIDTTTTAHEQHWDGQDGCEIYVDLAHVDESGPPAVQYSLYGQTLSAMPADGGVFPEWKNAVARARYRSRRHTFEWKIDVAAIADGRLVLAPQMTIGLDVAFTDRDRDGSFSWMSWGGRVVQLRAADRRADLVLVSGDSDRGDLRVSLTKQGSGQPLKNQRV